MKAVLTIYNSRRDTFGNVYYAVRLHERKGKAEARGTIGADNVSTIDCREVLDWYIERQELPVREFNRFTKGWPHLGCCWDEIKAALVGSFS